MKLEESVKLECSPKDAWDVISGLESYNSWNTHLTKIEGALEMDAPLNIQIQLMGKTAATAAKITGLRAQKYLSFQLNPTVGGWWFNQEYVIRLEEAAGATLVHIELYCYGLKLRFGKNKVRSLYGKSLSQFAWSLKSKFLKEKSE